VKIGLLIDEFKVNLEERPSGGENYFYDLARNLKSLGLEVTIFAYGKVEQKGFEGVSLGQQVPRNHGVKIFDMTGRLLKLRHILREMDIIHSIADNSVPALALIANNNTKFIFEFRNALFDTLWIDRWYKRIGANLLTDRALVQRAFNPGERVPKKALRMDNFRWITAWYRRLAHSVFAPDHVIFLDKRSYDDYHRVWPERSCSYHPSPVDIERFSHIQKSPKGSNQYLIVLYATRLEWHKGILDLLSIIDDVLVQSERVEFWLAGEGSLRGEAEHFAAERDRVRYLGYVSPSEMPALLQQADVLVQPSYYEGFGRTVLEGMACGLPLITTGVGGMYVLDDKGLARIVKPGDRGMLIGAILEMVENEDLRERYGQIGKKYVRKCHSWDSAVKRYLRLYENLMST
jgi:glycosyltransferase involved in cell wall biosynthesis